MEVKYGWNIELYRPNGNYWVHHRQFDTKAAALKWLDTKSTQGQTYRTVRRAYRQLTS